MHAVIWNEAVGEIYSAPLDRPLEVVSYEADTTTTALIQPLAVGQELPEIPLFLDIEWYVNIPLERTYMQAFEDVPRQLRDRYFASNS